MAARGKGGARTNRRARAKSVEPAARQLVTLLPEFADPAWLGSLVWEKACRGSGTHQFECGHCGHEVASGIDPRRYPAMFRGATHLRCAACSGMNQLPATLKHRP